MLQEISGGSVQGSTRPVKVPNNLAPDGIDDTGPHRTPFHPRGTLGHPSVALPSASIAQFADTSLSIGWVGGPFLGPRGLREEEVCARPTGPRQTENERARR